MVATYQTQADIVVRAANGGIVALVQTRNRRGLTADVASGTRRNLFVHKLVDLWTPFFLIVSQDNGFLWDQRNEPLIPDLPPTLAFVMTPVINHYLPSLPTEERLTKSQFELVVAQWLSDLTWDSDSRGKNLVPELHDIAFPSMIAGGKLEVETDV